MPRKRRALEFSPVPAFVLDGVRVLTVLVSCGPGKCQKCELLRETDTADVVKCRWTGERFRRGAFFGDSWRGGRCRAAEKRYAAHEKACAAP